MVNRWRTRCRLQDVIYDIQYPPPLQHSILRDIDRAEAILRFYLTQATFGLGPQLDFAPAEAIATNEPTLIEIACEPASEASPRPSLHPTGWI
jgi:hypothetical protein